MADRSGKHDDENGVTLFEGQRQSLNYTLVAKELNISTADLYFTPSAVTDSTVTLTADAGQGKTLVFNYRLGKNYMLHLDIKATGMSGLFDPNASRINVDWHETVRQQERGFNFENRYARLDWKTRMEAQTTSARLRRSKRLWTNVWTGWPSRTSSSLR